MQQLEVTANGFTFDAVVSGPSDGRPVLFLHGFPQTTFSWHHQLEALGAAGYRGLAYDQRGYSPRARPLAVDDYRIGELVGDVLAVADHWDLDRFDLVGHDWGAMVAWVVAARHPDRVRTLTAVSVPHPRAFAAAFGGTEGGVGGGGGRSGASTDEAPARDEDGVHEDTARHEDPVDEDQARDEDPVDEDTARDEDRVHEDRVAGARVAGDRVAGDRVAGDRVAEDRVAGDRVAGERDRDGDEDQRQRSSYIQVFRAEGGVAERALLGEDGSGDGLRAMFDASGLPSDTEEVRRFTAAMLEPGALTAALNWYRATEPHSLSDVGAITVPTLYVWSDQDIALGAKAAHATVDWVSAPYRFEVLTGVSHWIPETAPAELNRLLLEHLAAYG